MQVCGQITGQAVEKDFMVCAEDLVADNIVSVEPDPPDPENIDPSKVYTVTVSEKFSIESYLTLSLFSYISMLLVSSMRDLHTRSGS